MPYRHHSEWCKRSGQTVALARIEAAMEDNLLGGFEAELDEAVRAVKTPRA